MRHLELRKMIILSLYGELEDGERFLLEEHLKGCGECRQELEDLQQFHSYLGQEQASQVPAELLFQARHSLWKALDQDQDQGPAARPSLSGRLARWLRPAAASSSPAVGRWLAPALSGAAMLMLGLLGGYWMFSSGAAVGSGLQPLEGANIANVRFLDSDPSGNQFEVVYDEVRPVRLTGSIDDQAVRRILTHAAVNERNPGVRLRAVNELDEHLESWPASQIKQTLLISLQTDRNDGVRRRALEALQRLPFDADLQKAYLYVLQYDPNAGMRVAVINALELAALDGLTVEPGILDVLKERTLEDENDYVRIRSESFLKQVEFK